MRRRLGFAAIVVLVTVRDACERGAATLVDHLFPIPPEAHTRRHP